MITAKSIAWEMVDGETFGYITVGTEDYDIAITASIKHSMWERATNVRTWSVNTTADNGRIAIGTAEGLRNAKRDALAALNAHLKETAA